VPAATYIASVSAEKAAWSPRLVVSRPVGERSGRILSVEAGVVQVRTRRSVIRASFGSGLLARMAQDPDAAPRVGDRVRLRAWADGPVTVERVVARVAGTPEEPGEAGR
jgi:ribosome biogenesis GTPase